MFLPSCYWFWRASVAPPGAAGPGLRSGRTSAPCSGCAGTRRAAAAAPAPADTPGASGPAAARAGAARPRTAPAPPPPEGQCNGKWLDSIVFGGLQLFFELMHCCCMVEGVVSYNGLDSFIDTVNTVCVLSNSYSSFWVSLRSSTAQIAQGVSK